MSMSFGFYEIELNEENFCITYFAVKQYLQGNYEICKNDLRRKALCCVRICASQLSGQTMRSPVGVYAQTYR